MRAGSPRRRPSASLGAVRARDNHLETAHGRRDLIAARTCAPGPAARRRDRPLRPRRMLRRAPGTCASGCTEEERAARAGVARPARGRDRRRRQFRDPAPTPAQDRRQQLHRHHPRPAQRAAQGPLQCDLPGLPCGRRASARATVRRTSRRRRPATPAAAGLRARLARALRGGVEGRASLACCGHPDLATAAALAVAHQQRPAPVVEVVLAERERFPNTKPAAPEHDDQRTQPESMSGPRRSGA
jgi:hypothetical protein